MGTAIVTVKIMPETPENDLAVIETEAGKLIKEFAGERDTKVVVEPMAFGLKAINYTFVMDEGLGSPDVVAEKIGAIENVASAEITDVRRALG